MNNIVNFRMLLALSLTLPMLMLGAVHTTALGVCLVLSTLMLFFLARQRKVRLDFIGLLLLSIVAYIAFQMLPLPAALVKLLSPHAYALRESAMATAGAQAPLFMPITLDVTVTAVEFAKMLFYLSLYWGCKYHVRTRGIKDLLYLVVFAGVAGAAILLFHKIVMLEQVYGLYEPVHTGTRGDRVSAPLINENHMAAFLGMCATVTIGMAISASERSKRLMLIVLGAIQGGALMLTLSRGGIGAFVAGQLFFIVTMLSKKRADRHQDEGRILVWVPLGLAISLALGMFAAQDALIGEFVDGDERKIEMFTEAAPLFKRFFLFGAGRGAFVFAFPMVSDWAASSTFTHAENVVVQFLIDFGVVPGIIILAAFVFAVARKMIDLSSRVVPAACVAALFAVGIHNLVDFNLELPGVAAIAVALMAAIGNRTAEKDKRKRAGFKLNRWALGGGAATSLGMTVILFVLPSQGIEGFQSQAKRALDTRDATYFSDAHMKQVMGLHPASSYLPFMAGIYHLSHTDRNPLPFFSHALRLKPHYPAVHYYIGRTLLVKGYVAQALVEFRLGARDDARYARYAAKLLTKWIPSYELLREIARTNEDKRRLYEPIAIALQRQKKDAEAEKFDQAILALKPPTIGAVLRHTRRLAHRDEIEAALRVSKRLQSDDVVERALLEATVYEIAAQPEKVLRTLQKVQKAGQGNREYMRQLALAQLNTGDQKGALASSKRYRELSKNVSERAFALVLAGDLNTKMGNLHSAHARYRQASGMLPDNLGILMRLLHAAKNSNSVDSVQNTLYRLQKLEPENPQWKNELESLKNRNLLKMDGDL